MRDAWGVLPFLWGMLFKNLVMFLSKFSFFGRGMPYDFFKTWMVGSLVKPFMHGEYDFEGCIWRDPLHPPAAHVCPMHRRNNAHCPPTKDFAPRPVGSQMFYLNGFKKTGGEVYGIPIPRVGLWRPSGAFRR